jgi:hypothetical protein
VKSRCIGINDTGSKFATGTAGIVDMVENLTLLSYLPLQDKKIHDLQYDTFCSICEVTKIAFFACDL